MHHPKVLKKFGLTQDRLREIFTNKDATTKDGEIKKKFESRIRSRVQEGVRVCAEHASLFQAVDLAWDSPPIQKQTIPLLLWAQGKIRGETLKRKIENKELPSELIKKGEGNEIVVNMPRLYEMNVSLVRSYVTRRLAAQTARFANLWPYFRYEPRGVDAVTKLKAEALSMRVDVMVDSYNYRHLGTQLTRDMLLYGRSLAFPRSAWDLKTAWRAKDLNIETEDPEVESYVKREGIDFVNPHPARTYWDLSAPLPNINTDTGPAYIGYWDIVRYEELMAGNYYNTDHVSAGNAWTELVAKYQDFFYYYFDPRVLQWPAPKDDPSLLNARAANVGVYTAEDRDRGCLLVNHLERLNPKDEGICDYDVDIWIRFTVAGDGTIVGAEPMPSIPACYGGYNENDSRVVNASMAMELLPYQDQLSNLSSHMLMQIRTSLVQLWLLDKDAMEEETKKYFENGVKQKDFFTEPQLLMYSGAKLKEMGVDDPSKAFKIIQANVTNTIEACFNGMTRLLNLADRLMILSPNELGQPAPREISAREVQEISHTTSSISTFVSDGIDEQRAAMKRLLYESLITHSTENFRVPVLARYSRATLEKAGFNVGDLPNAKPGEDTNDFSQIVPIHTPIMGSVKDLIFEYVFDSRDGAERTPNTAVAETLTKLLQFLTAQPVVAQAMGKRRLIELVNEAVRLSGTGVDFQLSLDEGEDEAMGSDQLKEVVTQLQQQVAQLMKASGLDQQQPQAGAPAQAAPIAPAGGAEAMSVAQ